jgi:hypothetical protein
MKSRAPSTSAPAAFFRACCAAALATLACAPFSHAQVPRSINYQGYLSGTNGAAINASLPMTFTLYSGASGPVVHAETQTVTVSNGVFNVVLGTNAPLNAPFETQYWLGVRVGLDAEMTLRQPLVATPYAIRSAVTDAMSAGATAFGDVELTGSLRKGGAVFVHAIGSSNTAVGVAALANNTGGTGNVSVGTDALGGNTTGGANTAVGQQALWRNVGGSFNAAIGAQAMLNNAAGVGNTGMGFSALQTNLAGAFNTAVGQLALWKSSASNNTALGSQALENTTSGGSNIGIGASAGTNITTGSNNIAIGNAGVAGDSGSIRIGDSAVHSSTLLAGNVGIGTTTVTKAKLEINGGAGAYSVAAYGGLATTGATANNAAASLANASIYASGPIVGQSFIAHSDARIKRSVGRSNGARDLNTLAAIEITDYTAIDTRAAGNGAQKKVIAQQVEKVYPQAVGRSTDVVPDVYQKAEIKDGWVTLSTNLKRGERVRLIGKTTHGVFDILEVTAGRFRTAFKGDADSVFVYGREVADFRSVDYEAIAMLNVSATQELSRRIERQDAKIAQLEQALATVTQLQIQAQLTSTAASAKSSNDASPVVTALR